MCRKIGEHFLVCPSIRILDKNRKCKQRQKMLSMFFFLVNFSVSKYGNKFTNLTQNYCIELVEYSLEAEFNSTHDGEIFFRKLQFSGSGVQFSSLGKLAEI